VLEAEFCAILFTSILLRIGAMRAVTAAVLFVLIFVVAGADAAQVRIFAGARFDSKAWAKLQKLNVKELGKDRMLDAHVGQLVELHFQFRSKELRHLKPNWYQASIWQAAPEGKRGFVSVPVMLANTDLKAFEGFTTDHRSTADLKIYGQVLYDFGINYTFVRVIGANTFVDGEGYTNVTW
jgi:hypothetical protein